MVVLAVACSSTNDSPVATPVTEATSAVASSTRGTPEPGPSPVPGLTARATASTLFDTQRSFRLELSATGPEVAVVGLRLDSPWYEPVDPVDRDLRLADGAMRLVPLPYGPAVCTTASPPPVGGIVGEVMVDTADGVHRVPLTEHPAGLVAGRHGRECAVAAAREAVELTFGSDWTSVGDRAVTGVVHVRPRAGARVEVVRVGGNIVFTLDALDDLPVTTDGVALDLPVRVAAARCDTHALIEAKRSFHHVVEVVVDGGEPVVVEVEAVGDERRLFQGLLEACLDAPAD